jgi:hypothetical protein
MSKLTLHIQDELIVAAKREAAERNTSVSKLVSDYLRALAAGGTSERELELPPVTASLAGCLEGANTGKKEYLDYLEKKHS